MAEPFKPKKHRLINAILIASCLRLLLLDLWIHW